MTVRRFSPASSGLFSLSMLKTRPSSCTCMFLPTSGLIQKKLQESYQVVVEPHLPPHICSHDLILPRDNVHPGQLLLPLLHPPHPPLPPLLQFLALQLHLWSPTHQINSVDESYIIVQDIPHLTGHTLQLDSDTQIAPSFIRGHLLIC